MSRTSRTRSASAERAQTSSASSRSTPERQARLSAPHDRRSSEPSAARVIGPQGPSLTAAPTGSRLHITIGAVQGGATDSEDAMRKHLYIDEERVRDDHEPVKTMPRQLAACRIDC